MLSKYFYHGLNGQLCPECFQKDPRNLGFFFAFLEASAPHCTALYRYCTVLYSTVQCCTVLYSAVQCCTVLYCTVLFSER